jgi:hypothetical protein
MTTHVEALPEEGGTAKELFEALKADIEELDDLSIMKKAALTLAALDFRTDSEITRVFDGFLLGVAWDRLNELTGDKDE